MDCASESTPPPAADHALHAAHDFLAGVGVAHETRVETALTAAFTEANTQRNDKDPVAVVAALLLRHTLSDGSSVGDKVIDELRAENAELRAKNAELRDENARLQARLAELEAERAAAPGVVGRLWGWWRGE